MRVLFFVDLHGSRKMLQEIILVVKREKPSLIVCAGDFTVFEQDMDVILEKLNTLNVPLLIIHGNHETPQEVKKSAGLFTNIHFIHGKAYRVGQHVFLGCGGGGFSRSEPDIHQVLGHLMKKITKKEKAVLVVHAPPYKTVVDTIMHEHCGNISFRSFIKKTEPILCVCGHLHENAGKKDMLGKTKVINPGPKGMILEI